MEIEMIKLRLFLLSFLILLTELSLIRFIPAYIRLMGFFANITLMAVFLGMGLGMLWINAKWRAIYWFPLLLLIMIAITVSQQIDVQNTVSNIIFFTDINTKSMPRVEPVAILPFIFLLVALTVAAVSQEFGKIFAKILPLPAYTIDISGSLLAIIIFSALSFLGVQAWVWFAIIAGITLILTFGRSWRFFCLVLIPLGLTLFIILGASEGSRWSPYYRVTTESFGNSVGVYVNAIPNQLATYWQDKEPFYRIPYEEFNHTDYKKILILGSGTGNDIAIALALNPQVERIDAVEIDPTVTRIGVKLHPDHPYNDPRVHLTITDGRNFLANSKDRYDLIIFALTDSLVLTSQTSNIRLESFLFTLEAMKSAKGHLTSDGLVVFYNYYREPWLVDKIAQMAERSFDMTPYYYIFSKQSQSAIILDGPHLADIKKDTPLMRYKKTTDEIPATDDWPFLYVRDQGIPTFYLTILGVLMAITVTLIAGSMYIQRERGFNTKFFLFGAAFLLLETKSLATFSLLFGATWFVNSLVFTGILLSILAANLLSLRYTIRPTILYILLFFSLIVSAVYPTGRLMLMNQVLRYALSIFLYFSPIFFANMIFSQLFKQTRWPVLALASNVIGAVLGGVMEYGSMTIGYQALFIIIAGCYLIAYAIR